MDYKVPYKVPSGCRQDGILSELTKLTGIEYIRCLKTYNKRLFWKEVSILG